MNSRQVFVIRTLCILWPSFLMAGVLEMLVFSVVDPTSLQWFGNTPIEWSSTTIYSVAFLLFWGVISTSGAMTQLLFTMPSDHIEDGHNLRKSRPAWPA